VTLWGGRFGDRLDPDVRDFTADPIDRRLLPVDVEGSIAHVHGLEAAGLLDATEAKTIMGGLETIAGEAGAGTFAFAPSDEDVHTAVERRLVELVGDVGKMLHTGRSRNDQVALDLRLYLSRAAAARMAGIAELATVLADRAEEVADVVVPSYTHLQQAQPVSLGQPLLAYAWMLLRDRDRFAGAASRIAVSPLGAGAGGGSTLPLRPEVAAAELGFDSVFDNSLDAVASRDFAAEYVFACAQLMTHLSRLADEIVLWATSEFGWITIADSHATGSSALPHKKNPDVTELVRGRAAAVLGDVATLLALQKGLPLAYNRDLQEDKRAVFHADDTVATALTAMAGLLEAIEFHPPPPDQETTALAYAEQLVLDGVPFRDAHQQVGAMVSTGDLPTDLSPTKAANALVSPGGGSPASVRAQVVRLRDRIG
jgi:argininosuccinate lyase